MKFSSGDDDHISCGSRVCVEFKFRLGWAMISFCTSKKQKKMCYSALRMGIILLLVCVCVLSSSFFVLIQALRCILVIVFRFLFVLYVNIFLYKINCKETTDSIVMWTRNNTQANSSKAKFYVICSCLS